MRLFGKAGRVGSRVVSKSRLRSSEPQKAGILKQLPLLIIVLLALGAGAAGLAFAGPSDTDDPASGEDLLAFEQELALLESEARKRWPESFAGLWGSAGETPNRIYVAFVGNPRRKVEQLGAGFQASDLLVPVPARYSLEHLERQQARMVADRTAFQQGVLDPPPGLTRGRYDLDISLKENVVEAIVPANVESARAGVTRAYGDIDNPGTDDVRVVEGGLSRPFACSDRAHCGLQLRAGLKVLYEQGGLSSYCTSAFVVTRPATGATEILSAAHCGDENPSGDKENSRYHRGEIAPANRYGGVATQVYAGRVDAEVHSIGNGFTGNPWVYRTQEIQASPIYSVGTWDGLIVDQTRLCKAGAKTGYSCGYLRSKSYSPGAVPNSERFLGVQLEGSGSDHGDSGAPFVREATPTQAEGILHGGGAGACKCWTTAGHIEYAVQALGVSVITLPPPAEGRWFLRNSNSAGGADIEFIYGGPNIPPVPGDWNGDGVDTPGIYNAANCMWHLRNSNTAGGGELNFCYGGGSGTLGVTGDWNGDGVDTPGIYVPSTGWWHLRNSNTAGGGEPNFIYGGGTGTQPIVGDWNGDGVDTIGIYNPANCMWHLRNSNTAGGGELNFCYGGGSGTLGVTGDWNGDGVDTPGIYNPANCMWHLRDSNTAGGGDLNFCYGGGSGTAGMAGDWNGDGFDTIGMMH